MTSSTVPTEGPERLGPTRRRVLAHLQEVADPESTETMAEVLDLHPNTVRFHLDALLSAGLARRLVERRGVQGRPRVLFSAAPTAPPVTDAPYRALVQAMLGYLRGDEPPDNPVAERLGEAWGRSLAASAGDPEAGVQGLVAVVNGLGLSSRVAETDGVRSLEIVRCPFRELTLGGDTTVCRIHLGMMRGYLAATGADETVAELRPWVEPELCLARLAPVAEPGRRAAGRTASARGRQTGRRATLTLDTHPRWPALVELVETPCHRPVTGLDTRSALPGTGDPGSSPG